MPRRRLLLPTLFALLLAAPAQAAQIRYGSDLTGTANLTQSHPRDWAAWPTAAGGTTGIKVPQQGEVKFVELKGIVQRPPNDAAYGGKYPPFEFHIVVLRPQPDGTMKLLVSTVDMPVPYGGDPNQITTLKLQNYPARMCAEPGDVVAIATSGGFGNSTTNPTYGGYPDEFFANGYPVQMFSRVPDAAYGLFKQPEGHDTFQVGDTVPKSTVSDQELLMRVTIGTAADARWTCRTDAERAANYPNPDPNYVAPDGATDPAPVPSGSAPAPGAGLATLVKPSTAPKVRGKKVKLAVACSAAGPCKGTLGLRNYAKTKAFSIPVGTTATVTLVLNKTAASKLKRKGARLTVKATVANAGGVKSSLRFLIKRA